ncbi:MAG TPA: immunoglobulin domain-containing protein [Verrucomicrobiae bacterium]|nr:immunoglobulin domain-containing protein [Verrucomicrobiae bacterium]
MTNPHPLKSKRTTLPARLVARIGFGTALLLVLTGGLVQAASNVLINSGFETGDSTGWTPYGAHAVESTNNLYYNGGSTVGASNVLTHSGEYVGKTYGSFTGGYNSNGYYQDVVAGAGSVWSASGFALSHRQDLIQSGNQFWFEVTFRDSTDQVLALYRSYILDPSSADGVVSNTWYDLAVTNAYDLSDPYLTTITNTVSSFTAPAGTAKVRYQVLFVQLGGYPGGSIYFDDLNLTKIAGTDPDISESPLSHTRIVGQSVTFSVTAAGGTTLHYQWQKDSTDLVDGGNISGATTASLTVSNLTIADAGSYTVRVSDVNGSITTAPATLTIVTAVEAANYLSDPGLEAGPGFAPYWSSYNGAAIVSTNNYYFGTGTPVDVHGGTNAGQAYGAGAGSYNGFYQDVRTDDIHTVAPGSIFVADGWVYTSSSDQIAADNTAWVEVHFHDGNGNIIGLYKSAIIDSTFPTDTWIDLPVTNIIAFYSDYSVVGNTRYLTAPAGTAYVRYQTVFHVGTQGGAGSVYFDDMSLVSKLRVTVGSSVSTPGTFKITFPTQVATTYQVLYKNDLTDPAWQLLTTVTGDGTVKTVTDPIGPGKRFYTVSTL